MHWLASHWQQVAAVLACLVLYWLSVYVSRTPTLRASGLVTLLGDVLLALIAPIPGVGPVLARVLVVLRLATAPDRGTREMDVDPDPVRPSPALTRVAALLLAAGLATSCASWRNDQGGLDPLTAARRERIAAVVDCTGPVVLQMAGEIALGAVGLALAARLGDPLGWAEVVRPVVSRHEAALLGCLAARPTPPTPEAVP